MSIDVAKAAVANAVLMEAVADIIAKHMGGSAYVGELRARLDRFWSDAPNSDAAQAFGEAAGALAAAVAKAEARQR